MNGPSIAVFGTSNGLFKDGYVGGLEDVLETSNVFNRSIGASTSLVWFVSQIKEAFSDVDFCLIDYCVNDDLMITAGASSLQRWRESLLRIVAELRKYNCEPVLLIMPSRQSFTSTSLLRHEAQQFAHEFRLPYIDVFGILEYIKCSMPAADTSSLFQDASHLNVKIARSVGRLIGRALLRLPEAPNAIDHYDLLCPAYRVVDDWDVDPSAIVERSTSLLSRKFLSLREGEVARFSLNYDENVVGVGIDLAKSNGVMAMSGDKLWRKSWTNAYYAQWRDVERAMVFCVLPVMGLVTGDKAGQIAVRVQSEAASAFEEAWGTGIASVSGDPSLALAAVIARSRPLPERIGLFRDCAVDLLELCGYSFDDFTQAFCDEKGSFCTPEVFPIAGS